MVMALGPPHLCPPSNWGPGRVTALGLRGQSVPWALTSQTAKPHCPKTQTQQVGDGAERAELAEKA